MEEGKSDIASSTASVEETTAASAAISGEASKCPNSPGTTEKPLLKSSSDNTGEFGCCEDKGFNDDEDEHVCPICLDNFEVDDTVMWSSRNEGGSCSHVFHEDCLMQWL